MQTTRSRLYCSEASENAMTVRSFGVCPECSKIWDGQHSGGERHYRNNAWKLCDTCALQQHRCVVCGSTIDRQVRGALISPGRLKAPEPEDEHYAYVQDIADRLGLPPHVVAPVFHETLHTLAAGATVETFVVLLAAKKTLTKLRKMPNRDSTSQ